MKFGFAGLGQMGAPMATNMLRDHGLLVTSLDEAAVARLQKLGADVAGCPSDFADVDALILCLPDVKVVKEVLFDDVTGLARHLKPDTIVIDTGTSEYNATLEIGAKLQAAGLRFLDAPVSGMQARAEDGSLTMMVGGSAGDLAEVRDALATMASAILHMGQAGSGQLTKLINQLLFNINAAALAEILPMSSLLGIDPEKVAEVVNSGTARSYASEFFIPHILNGDFSNGYPMQAAYKDLISGAQISTQHNVPAPVLAAATGTYQQALREGHGDKDKGAMILVFERLLGVAFRAGKKDKS